MVIATFGAVLRTWKWRLSKVWILAERAVFSRDCSQPSLALLLKACVVPWHEISQEWTHSFDDSNDVGHTPLGECCVPGGRRGFQNR